MRVVVTTTNDTTPGPGLGDITFDGSSNGPILIARTNTNTNANTLSFNADRNIVFSSGTTTFQRSSVSTGNSLTVELNPGTTNIAGKIMTNAGATVVLDGVNYELSLIIKNGNAHVTFKRMDLVDTMNRIIAKHYPGALAAPK